MKVLDLFSGCGGLSLGLEQAGFEVSLGIDCWQDALDTFKLNHSNSNVLCADLGKLDFSSLDYDGFDVIVGGPPCQGFSISGKRNPDDPRNKLYIGFVNAVKFYLPDAFIMENVPNLASMNQGRIKDTIVSEFKSLGYSINFKRLLASDYGVPQNRRRFIMVGLKKRSNFEFPTPTHAELGDKLTTSIAISDLPEGSVENGSRYLEDPKSAFQSQMRLGSAGIFNHQITQHTEKTKSIIALVPDGGNYKDLPEEYKKTRNVNIAWTRFSSKKPSFTIDTGHRHHFHYKYDRVPTVRESARLQSFPDNFIFLGSKTSQYKQVGNAVPPILGKILGEALYSQI